MLFQLCTYKILPAADGSTRMGIAKVAQYYTSFPESVAKVDYVIDCYTGRMLDPRKTEIMGFIIDPLSFIDTRYTGG